MPWIEPGAAGWEASMLPLSYAAPLKCLVVAFPRWDQQSILKSQVHVQLTFFSNKKILRKDSKMIFISKMRVVSVLCLFFSWMWPRSGPWRSRHRTSSTRSCASGTTSSTASPRMKRKRCLKDPRAFWSLGNICFNVSKSDQSYRLVYLELSTAVVKYEPIYSGATKTGQINQLIVPRVF